MEQGLDTNDLGLLLPKASKADGLRAVMLGTTSTSPEQHAVAVQTARKLEVPTQIVLGARDKLPDLSLQSIDFDRLAEKFPKTSQYLLSDPDHAKISKKDLDNMMLTEELLQNSDFSSKGIFDAKTRDTVVKYLRDEGYTVEMDTSDVIAQKRPNAAPVSPNATIMDQIGAGFAAAFDPVVEQQQGDQKRLELPTEPRGMAESALLGLERASFVPFLSSVPDAIDAANLYSIGRRSEKNEMTSQDWVDLLKMDNEVRRGTTRLGKATDILMSIPAYGGEIASTLGTGAVASTSAKVAVKRGALHVLRKSISGKALITAQKALLKSGTYQGTKMVAGGLARVAAIAATGGSLRTAVATLSNLLPQFNKLTEEQLSAETGTLQAAFKESEMDFIEALGRAYGDQMIEVGTELLGVKLSKLYSYLGKKTGVSGLQAAIASRWFKLNPTSTASQFTDQLRKYGWDGILEEWSEERIASLMRMTLGWEEWGVDLEGQMSELIAFSVLGGIGFGVHARKARLVAVDAAARAQAQVEHFEDLAVLSTNSETRRLVPGLQTLQAQLAAENGPVETLYFSNEAWNSYWESKGLSGRQAAISAGISEADYDSTFSAAGSLLPVPIGAYIENLAGTEHNQQLSRIARLSEDAPNVEELESIIAANAEAHDGMVSLAQSRADAEKEKDTLIAEAEQIKAELDTLTVDATVLTSPEALLSFQEKIAAATDPAEAALLSDELQRVTEIQARFADLNVRASETAVKVQQINDRLTEIRRRELSFNQAAIGESQETKDLADKLFSELQQVFATSDNTWQYQPSESALRLQSALAARMVANLANRSGISMADFVDRFALDIRGTGIVVPVSRTQLTQSRIAKLESDYAEATSGRNLEEAQRIVNEVTQLIGSPDAFGPIEFGPDEKPKTLAERFGAGALRKANAEQLRAAYSTFSYSMEMIVGNNTGSPLVPMINAPLWVKMQYDAEIRAAYREPGTGVDLLAAAFGLTVEPGTIIAPSAYINGAGQLEINPSGQIQLIPKATSELNRPDWNSEIVGERKVLSGETWESIVIDGLYPEYKAATKQVKDAKSRLKKATAKRESLVQKGKSTKAIDSDIASINDEISGKEKQIAGLKKLVDRSVKKIISLNDALVQPPAPAPATLLPPEEERQTRHRVFEGGSVIRASGEGAFIADDPSMAYRITGKPQIDDIIQSGVVRAKEGKMRGGKTGETQWSRGDASLGYNPIEGKFILVAPATIDEMQGGLPASELTRVLKAEGGKWVDITESIKSPTPAAAPSQPTILPPSGTIKFLTRSSARLKAYTLAHGLMQQQEAISGHVVVPMGPNDSINDANGVSIVFGRSLNVSEIQTLFSAAMQTIGAEGAKSIGYFPTTVGFKLVNFGINQNDFLKLIEVLYQSNFINDSNSSAYFKLNWDLGVYEVNSQPNGGGISEFEKQLRQSGFWSEFERARDRVQPRSRALSALWEERIARATGNGGIHLDAAWVAALESTGGVANIARTQLTGTPLLSITSESQLKAMAGSFLSDPNLSEDEIEAKVAMLIRLDAYRAVETQESAEGRTTASYRKKLVEQLAVQALQRIQGLPEIPEALLLSMSELSIGAVSPQQKYKTITDFLSWAEGELGNIIGKSDPSELDGSERERVATALYQFVLARLAAKQASGVDWYLAAVQASMAIVHNIHPELGRDKDLERLYKAMIAVTSQGQRVEQNFIFADSVYRFYREFGKLPNLVSFGGKSKGIIEANFVKLQNLINSRGLKGAMDLLETAKTADEVNKLFSEVMPDATGKDKKLVSGELSRTLVRGAMLLGPKIGSFFGNLQFLFDTVTMDVWFTRTIQRILGRPFGLSVGEEVAPRNEKLPEHGKSLSYSGLKGSLQRLLFAIQLKQKTAAETTKQKRVELQAAVAAARQEYEDRTKAGKLTDSEKRELKQKIYYAEYAADQVEYDSEDKVVAKEIEAFLKKQKIGDAQNQVAPLLARTMAYTQAINLKFAADQFKLKTEYNRSAKGIDEALTKGLEAPTSGEYRNSVREIMDILRDKLKRDGIDLEQADLQAVLWYGEKDLYWIHGVADIAEGQDYAYSAAFLYSEKLRGKERAHRQIVGHSSLSGDIEKFTTKKTSTPGEVQPGTEEQDDEEDGGPEGTGMVTLAQRTKRGRDPVLQQAAEDFAAGMITGDEYRKMVDERAPLREFDEVPIPATAEEIAYGLGEKPVRADGPLLKRDLIVEPSQIGSRMIESRLDIPAYDQRGIWVVSLHEDTGPLRERFRKAGSPVGYSATVRLQGVQFRTEQKAALKIASGVSKSTIATMRGENVPQSNEDIYQQAVEALSNPAWVEIGFNPVRSSMFYRKDTGAPVTDAAEVLQVGGMVLAKSPTSDPSVTRLYQPVWHGSNEVLSSFSARAAGEFSGLGWGIYFTDQKEMIDSYRRAKDFDVLGNPLFADDVIYSVEIPDNNMLLDFDVSFEQQSDFVKAALSATSTQGLDEFSKKNIQMFRMGFIKTGGALLARLGGGRLVAGRIDSGDTEAAALTLGSLGISGRRGAGARGETAFVMWDPAAVSVLRRVQQLDEDQYRGAVTFDMSERGGTQRKFELKLTRHVDPSTFFHEMMHYYLEVLGDVAAMDGVAQEVKDDMATIIQWWGKRPGGIRSAAGELARLDGNDTAASVIAGMSDDEIRNALQNWRSQDNVVTYIGFAAHEELAENWEAYLYSGEAPIPELQTVFQRVKKWLAKVYQSLVSIGNVGTIDLSDDIKRVFDRIVASDVEIKAAEARESVEPMFSTKPDGMPDEVWNKYKSFLEKASERARERIGAELMASERAAMRKERAEYRKTAGALIKAELQREPEYIALAIMRTGRMPDGSEPVAPLLAFKLDKGSLLEMPDMSKEKMKKLRGLGVYTAKDGVTPSQAAELLGYDSADHLIGTLLNIRPLADVLKERVAEAVELEYPGLVDNPAEMSKAATEAIRNEFREDVIALEMAELGRMIRADKKALRRVLGAVPQPLSTIANRILQGTETEANAAIGILGSYAILREAAAQRASAQLDSVRIRDIRPNVFAVAAKRSAQEATRLAAAGKYIEALSAKESELNNTALHRRAVELRERADKQAAWLDSRNSESSQSKLGLAGASYQEQMNDILERFNFRPIPLTQVDKRMRLREWVESQRARGYTVEIDDQLLDEAFRQDFRNLTTAELDSVYSAARQIYHIARTKLEIIVNRRRKDFAELVDTLVSSISANKKPLSRPIGALSKQEKMRDRIAAAFGSMRKLGSLVRELDGFTEGGPLYWAFMDPVNRAANEEAVLRERSLLALQQIFDAYSPEERSEFSERKILAVNGKQFSLSKEDLLTMALNWGTESNRQRLVSSNPDWQESDIVLLFKQLDKRDWDFVQSVWDHIGSYWPEIEAKQKRVYGIAPERVLALPLITDHGAYSGGYYPLKYRGAKSEFDNQADAAKAMMEGAVGASTTRRGHLKGRLETVELPLRLGFDVLTNHLNQVIHDLTHHEMLIQTARILRNRNVIAAIETFYGTDMVVTIRNLLDAVAVGDTSATEHGSLLYKYLRNGAQTAIMGFNLMTSMQQIFGLTQSIPRVGALNLLRATQRWLTSPAHGENTVEWVYSKSSFMRLRGKTQDRELNEIFNTIEPSLRTTIQSSYYYLIQRGQLLADMPTWLGTYDRAVSEGIEDEQATALADQAVIDTQGAGQIKDLALAQQGGSFQKLFTLFYSYFSATYNLNVETIKAATAAEKAEWGKTVVDLLVLNSLPVAVNLAVAVAIGKTSGDEDLLARLAKDQFSFLLTQNLFTREFSGLLEGRDYEGPAGLRPIADIYKLAKAISTSWDEEEMSRNSWKQLNKVAGTLFHYPAIQLQRTVEGAKALWEGNTRNPLVLLRGPNKEERGE